MLLGFSKFNDQKPKQNARADIASSLGAPPLDSGQSGRCSLNIEPKAGYGWWKVHLPHGTLPVLLLLGVFFMFTSYHEPLRGRETSPACLPFNSSAEGMRTETPLCAAGCLNGVSPHKVSVESKGLILPPSLSPHNNITNSLRSFDDMEC